MSSGLESHFLSKKEPDQIAISRSVFGVTSKIEYLGLSTHRGGSNGVLRFWFRNTTDHFIVSNQFLNDCCVSQIIIIF